MFQHLERLKSLVKFSPILRNLWNKDIQTTLNEGPIILEVKKKNDVAFMKNEWIASHPSPLENDAFFRRENRDETCQKCVRIHFQAM